MPLRFVGGAWWLFVVRCVSLDLVNKRSCYRFSWCVTCLWKFNITNEIRDSCQSLYYDFSSPWLEDNKGSWLRVFWPLLFATTCNVLWRQRNEQLNIPLLVMRILGPVNVTRRALAQARDRTTTLLLRQRPRLKHKPPNKPVCSVPSCGWAGESKHWWMGYAGIVFGSLWG